jgi:hypothetical protein
MGIVGGKWKGMSKGRISMASINWNRARKFKGAEAKYETGTVLKNGAVVVNDRPDDLAKRAKQAEREWIKRQKIKEKL